MMAGEEMIKARPKELKRVQIIGKVLERGIKQVEAAEILDLSSRQIRRIVKRVKLEGDKGVLHKSSVYVIKTTILPK
jgi:transposase